MPRVILTFILSIPARAMIMTIHLFTQPSTSYKPVPRRSSSNTQGHLSVALFKDTWCLRGAKYWRSESPRKFGHEVWLRFGFGAEGITRCAERGCRQGWL
ncbi:hypothetical protein BOTBODRAFT_36388 [Botryobasidium botryosum FD-172 SS1]|uniref:Secreted protein n=1 Tax=Botryobasidium botryosum (strain FD-172 SS1) TaxID=930990 RepID=A0A067MFA5_BOTB1|nr:hypothetical protein BOTBODRAFT_36388 [Botryobasidium botryosum FD-172 SS1]